MCSQSESLGAVGERVQGGAWGESGAAVQSHENWEGSERAGTGNQERLSRGYKPFHSQLLALAFLWSNPIDRALALGRDPPPPGATDWESSLKALPLGGKLLMFKNSINFNGKNYSMFCPNPGDPDNFTDKKICQVNNEDRFT